MKKIFVFILFFCSALCKSQIDTSKLSSENYLDIILTNKNYSKVRAELSNLIKSGRHTNVKQLSIRGDFDSIPSICYELSNTEELEINSTRKIRLNKGLNGLNKLVGIRVTSEVASISDSITLNNIVSIDIENYTATKFPFSICRWKELTHINIQSGKFSNIPKEIQYLTKLKVINLSNNRIKIVPNKIGELVNLEVLSLGKNCITSLPLSICKLQNLRELYILQNPKLILTNEQMDCIKKLPRFENLFK